MSHIINKHHYCAEIVESSLLHWTAQCWRWDAVPEFGSLVCVASKKRSLYAIVYGIKTGSLDSNRYPFAYQKTEDELMAEQPQIFEFLKTHIDCITLGYEEHEKIYYHMPPEPPKIHAFVGPIHESKLNSFFARPDFLHLLLKCPEAQYVDELILGLIAYLKKQTVLTPERLTSYLDTLSVILGADYKRFSLLLARIEALGV